MNPPMKIRRRFTAIFAISFVLSASFPMFILKAHPITEETGTEPENAEIYDEEIAVNASLSEITTISWNETKSATEEEGTDLPQEDSEIDFPIPDQAPAFDACIKYWTDYTVVGTFTDLTPDIIQIQTMHSLDGENWKTGIANWNLYNLGTNDEDKLKALQNQPCLFATYEPLKSYIAGKIDRFYLKLHITKRNGLSYDTQSAVIERAGLQPFPKETQLRASFSSAIMGSEPDPSAPYRRRRYGKYNITVAENATAEDIAALLPDTLPVEVWFDCGPDFIASGIVDCPVTWKPLSLPSLCAGESVTISDAAEEILVPVGTLVSTPLGIFQLEEPLSLNSPPSTDEVRLTFNGIPEDRNPTGVLGEGTDGLELAFHNNPTGAASIRAYVLTEGESKWTELSGLSLSEDLNQPSTINSGYTLILRNDQEPYQSYRIAADAGETPVPFFIGLKIEGGIYDGKQLILAWPDIYEQLPTLPELGGAGGNEGNAGTDNEKDSTEGGQRPNLPQTPDPGEEEPQPSSPVKKRKQQTNGTADDSEHKQTPSPDAPKTVSSISENQNVTSTDESGSNPPGNRPGNRLISDQSPLQSQTMPDTGTLAASQKESRPFAPVAVQTVTDEKEAKSRPAPSEKDVIKHTTENKGLVPLLLMTAATTAASVCLAAGHRRIFRKTRNILHK